MKNEQLKIKTYYYECTDPDSVLCGEEFFVEATTKEEAERIAHKYFGINEELTCHGTVSEFEAECMGLDTY